jgi:hypothetical protein
MQSFNERGLKTLASAKVGGGAWLLVGIERACLCSLG